MIYSFLDKKSSGGAVPFARSGTLARWEKSATKKRKYEKPPINWRYTPVNY